MFIHEYPSALALRRSLVWIHGQVQPVRSVGLSPDATRGILERVGLALASLEDLENIEATTADPPHVRAGVVVVQFEVSPYYADALGRFVPYLKQLQRLARGKALTDASAAERIVRDILHQVELARQRKEGGHDGE